MKGIWIKLVLCALAIASIVILFGCGSASSNNDQGVSFTLVGFPALEEGACPSDPELWSSGGYLYLNLADSAVDINPGTWGCAYFQNNMTTVGVRLIRILISYEIPGSNINPPSSASATGFYLSPSPITATSPTSSLPAGFGKENTTGISAGYAVVPPDVLEWMNFNSMSLPEPPFVMLAHVKGVGQTTAGDVLETNELTYELFVQPSPDIAPGGGTNSSEDSSVDGAEEGDFE